MLDELRQISKKEAKNNTIIVITCNMGQYEILMNLAWSAKARGIRLENVLVFPTDEETTNIYQGLGLDTFYDQILSFYFVLSDP